MKPYVLLIPGYGVYGFYETYEKALREAEAYLGSSEAGMEGLGCGVDPLVHGGLKILKVIAESFVKERCTRKDRFPDEKNMTEEESCEELLVLGVRRIEETP